MPGGKYDSSKTRVVPVFEQLAQRSDDWVRTLISLPRTEVERQKGWAGLNLSYQVGKWGDDEARLAPAPSLLAWLLKNPGQWAAAPDTPERQRLFEGDTATLETALRLAAKPSRRKEWFILEGHTAPDVYIETPDALIVVEGKRTEGGPTCSTKWMAGRHQVWRHIEAAWEVRGHRKVFGFLIVDGNALDVPPHWQAACTETVSGNALAGSFPHRERSEIDAICQCFLGVTTWQRVCDSFGVSHDALPDCVQDSPAGSGQPRSNVLRRPSGRSDVPELKGTFQSLSLLAAREDWCWKLVCTTCGHMHFRWGLSALAKGLNPTDPDWPVHRGSSGTSSSMLEQNGPIPPRGGWPKAQQRRVQESIRRYSVDLIARTCRFPNWLGHLGIFLFYTEAAERENLIATQELVPQLLRVVESGSSAEAMLQNRLSQNEPLRWNNLEMVESQYRGPRRYESDLCQFHE
jgi:hypothetical protein